MHIRRCRLSWRDYFGGHCDVQAVTSLWIMFVIGVITLRTFLSSLVCGLGLDVSVLRSPCLCLASDTLISPWSTGRCLILMGQHLGPSSTLLLFVMCCPVRAPGRNALLIRSLILAVYIVCLFISYASPLILFFFTFFYLSNIDSFETRPALFSGQVS